MLLTARSWSFWFHFAQQEPNDFSGGVGVASRLQETRDVRGFIAGGDEGQVKSIFRIYLGEANGRHQSVADTFAALGFLQRAAFADVITVSYTHLRAHETGRNLVCR